MKSSRIILSIFAILFIIAACNNTSEIESYINNPFFGDYPSTNRHFDKIITQKEAAYNKAKGRKAKKILEEIKALRQKKADAIEAFVAAQPQKTLLPFERLDNTPYNITNVFVEQFSHGAVRLQFDMVITEDIPDILYLITYYKAIDNNGNTIPYSKIAATKNARHVFDAGSTYTAYGVWAVPETIYDLEYFAKVVEITKDEFDEQ